MFFNIFFIGLLVWAIICATLISVADFRRRIIPDAYLFPLMLSGLLLVAFYNWPINITDAAIGATFGYFMSAIVGFIFDWHIRKKNPDAIAPIGLGDIKLIGVGGLWLGVNGLGLALVVACTTGMLWALIKKQKYIPFGPFFIIGGILALLANTFLL